MHGWHMLIQFFKIAVIKILKRKRRDKEKGDRKKKKKPRKDEKIHINKWLPIFLLAIIHSNLIRLSLSKITP